MQRTFTMRRVVTYFLTDMFSVYAGNARSSCLVVGVVASCSTNAALSGGARKMVLVVPSFNRGATALSPPLPWGQILFRGGQAPLPPHWRRGWWPCCTETSIPETVVRPWNEACPIGGWTLRTVISYITHVRPICRQHGTVITFGTLDVFNDSVSLHFSNV